MPQEPPIDPLNMDAALLKATERARVPSKTVLYDICDHRQDLLSPSLWDKMK